MKLLLTLPYICLLASCSGSVPPPLPAIALTFDVHATTPTVAFPIMKARGLVGTYFIDPNSLEKGGVTLEQLREMGANGWSVQAYSGVNLVELLDSEGPLAAKARLIDMRDRLGRQGFPVTALAPSGRAWNMELRNLSVGIFSTVRVAKNLNTFQAIPFLDPLYVNDGGTESLSAADTIQRLSAHLATLQTHGGLWIVVAHKVGDDTDPLYSVPVDVFTAFCDLIVREVAAGRLQVVRIN